MISVRPYIVTTSYSVVLNEISTDEIYSVSKPFICFKIALCLERVFRQKCLSFGLKSCSAVKDKVTLNEFYTDDIH